MDANGKRILIVEDEKDTVRWLSILFREHGYQTDWAYDGREGFEKAEASPPDLITLDISMPGESGIKMYGKLLKSEKTADIPVVMITVASPKLEEFLGRLKSKKAPAGFFEKPIDKDELMIKIKALIG
jgi:DNA-binding response OmpR family regulator